MHDEGKVGLGLGRQHTGRREPGVVDEGGVLVALPLDGVGRIADDGLEGLVVPVLRRGKSVPVGNIELVIVDVVEEHIDAAQVVGGDLLAIKPLAHMVAAQYLGGLQQQGAGPAGGIVDFVDLRLAIDGDTGQQLGHLLGREVLAAALAGVGGVHTHQVLVGVAKSVDGVVLIVTQLHVPHAVHQLHQPLVALGHRAAQLVAVHVHVVEQALEIVLAVAALAESSMAVKMASSVSLRFSSSGALLRILANS